MAPTRSDRGTLRLAAGLAVGLVVGLVAVSLQPDLLRTSLPLSLLVTGAVVAAIAGLALARRSIRIEEARDDAVRLSAEAAEREATATREIARLVADEKARNLELSEASQRQAATAEILRVIASSRADVQPVFDAIARSAARLCDGLFSTVVRVQVGMIELAAQHGFTGDAAEAMRQAFPAALDAALPSAQALRTRDVVHVADTDASPYRDFARGRGYRSILSVPFLREGEAIGAVAVGRREPGAFSHQQISLLQAFAAQAIIAIENARLFQELQARNRELTESLERETATSGILRAIATSPTDPRPVFETILESALRLCRGTIGGVALSDGRLVSVAAVKGRTAFLEAAASMYPRRLTDSGLVVQAIRTGVTVHVADVLEDHSSLHEVDEAGGIRAELDVPMLFEGRCIGVISVLRDVPGLFSAPQVALVHTLADQAAIAVENVRLFHELEARNRDLTEALERERATSGILRAIATSPTDSAPVFEAILDSAMRLCRASIGAILLSDGELVSAGASEDGRVWPRLCGWRIRAVSMGQDWLCGPSARASRCTWRMSWRIRRAFTMSTKPVASAASSPCLCSEGAAVSDVIVVARAEAALFSEPLVALVHTLADQAAIAVENVRLFRELEARNHELTEALEQRTATGEILRVISSSPTDLQPVFGAIARSAVALCGGMFSGVFRFDGEMVHFVAQEGMSGEAVAAVLDTFPRRPTADWGVGRAILTAAVSHIPDIEEDPEIQKGIARTIGYRSFLSVPMLRDGRVVGAINVGRAEPGLFAEEQVTLLQTFAAQAVIAIENVRLFQELQARNGDLTEALEQQTATNEILRTISSSPTDFQPVMDAVAENAARVCGAANVIILKVEEGGMRLVAFHGAEPGVVAPGALLPVTRGSVAGRAILDRRSVHVEDVAAAPDDEYPETRGRQSRTGTRTVLGTPLLREGTALGAIFMWRREVRSFSPREIRLLETFADQAVIAIENVRLFTELGARNRELSEALDRQTATSEVLKVISRSTFDLGPVLATLLENAARLCGADSGFINRFDGDVPRVAAEYRVPPEFAAYRRTGEYRLTRGVGRGRAGSRSSYGRCTSRTFWRTPSTSSTRRSGSPGSGPCSACPCYGTGSSSA